MIVRGTDGTATVTSDGVAACLYQDCDPATQAWALAGIGPQPMITLAEPPRDVVWRSKPSTYVVCADDMALHPGLQRLFATRCTEQVEWPTSHSPFASRPDLVADLLVDLAR